MLAYRLLLTASYALRARMKRQRRNAALWANPSQTKSAAKATKNLSALHDIVFLNATADQNGGYVCRFLKTLEIKKK
jgi:hypothetical protein